MKEIKPIIIANIICFSAMMMFISVVGPIIRELGLQEWHAGLSVTLAGIFWVVMARFWGRKSDLIGRKKILIIGIFGFSLSYLVLAIFVNAALLNPPSILLSLLMILITRMFLGIFYSAIPTASNALIADKIVPNLRASYMAKLGAASGVGMVLGPTIGGFLAVYGLALPLYIAAIFPFFTIVILYVMLPADKPLLVDKQQKPKLIDKRLYIPMLAAFLTMYSVSNSQVCMGFLILDVFKVSPEIGANLTGYAISCIGVFFIISQLFVVKHTNISVKNWIKLGSILTLIGFMIMAMMQTKLMLFVSCTFMAIGLGMIFPSFAALAANLVNTDEQGAAAGAVSSAQGLGTVIAPIVSTVLYGFNPKFPFLVAGFSFIILFFAISSIKKEL